MLRQAGGIISLPVEEVFKDICNHRNNTEAAVVAAVVAVEVKLEEEVVVEPDAMEEDKHA
jgi:hypothetical protein